MATKSVTIVLPHGRHFIIKVTPNSSIQQILEEACLKAGRKSNETDLTFQKKVLDTALTVRFANLPNNCNLELQPSKNGPKMEKLVTVGLQLESGERLLHDFPSSTTLSNIIQHWQETKGELLERGNNPGEPVCIYMRKEIIGVDELRRTTLNQLGATSGRVMIRLVFRVPSSLKEQAHVEDIRLKKTTDVANCGTVENQSNNDKLIGIESAASISSGTNQISMSEPENTLEKPLTTPLIDQDSISVLNEKTVENESCDIKMECNDAFRTNDTILDEEMKEVEESEEQIIYIGEREALLFHLESAPKLPLVDLPEEFFEHTEKDIRYLYSDLKKQIQILEDKPLMLTSTASQTKENKLLQYESTFVRVHFPDRFVFQAKFDPRDKLITVKDFVRQFLEERNLNFYLYTTPPKNVLNDEMSLYQAALVPAANVYFGCDQKDYKTLLKEELKLKVSTFGAANRKARELRSCLMPSSSNQKLEMDNCLPSTSGSSSLRRDQNGLDNVNRVRPITKNPPKWFKLSK